MDYFETASLFLVLIKNYYFAAISQKNLDSFIKRLQVVFISCKFYIKMGYKINIIMYLIIYESNGSHISIIHFCIIFLNKKYVSINIRLSHNLQDINCELFRSTFLWLQKKYLSKKLLNSFP